MNIKSFILKNKRLAIGGSITAIMVILAVTGLFFTPYDPNAMDISAKLSGISPRHIMGCDNFGRDIFSRVLAGLSTTMVVAVGTVFIGIVFGTLIGAFTGYYGGYLDEIMMRFNDAVLAFPSLLLALVFISVMGSGKLNVTIALGILFIPSYARIMRGEFLKCRNLDYVMSARLMGASDMRIMFVHILPNTVRVMLSTIAIGFNNAVLAEAGMSYLGIGVQPPDASLGRMLSEAQSYLFVRPGYAVCTGMAIVLLILGFSMLSEGLEKNA
ncbi:MAG: ABC transporter permease [Lachnospiraceae bacterium]|nr:ABC transporter permease [Lachnospiraceae bacterium]